MNLEEIVEKGWESTCRHYEKGKFTPELEEDIQCFLYHSCLEELKGDAAMIHAKVSRGTKARKGEWVFPDLSLGRNDELVVEIKFVGRNFKSQQASRVMRTTLEALGAMSHLPWYTKRKRMLVFFDERKHFWDYDRSRIAKAGPGIRILFYPKSAPKMAENGSVDYPEGWNES